jgi:lipopolysaccharide biosynthesis glycosyltransferase
VCYDGDQSAAMGYWKIPGGKGGRLRSQVLPLHVGYNMKADQGPQACLSKRNLNASDLHVVHFSGKQKPFSMFKNKDDTWKAARESYMRHFKKWEVLLGVPSCTEKQLLKTNMGCYTTSQD